LLYFSNFLIYAQPGFVPGAVFLRFVVDKVVQGKVLLRVLLFSPAIIIQPMRCTDPHIAVNGRTNWRSLEILEKKMLFENRGSLARQIYSCFFFHAQRFWKSLLFFNVQP